MGKRTGSAQADAPPSLLRRRDQFRCGTNCRSQTIENIGKTPALKLIILLIKLTDMKTRKPTPARTPGRPANTRGDPRGKLLDVSVALFSRNGIAQTPLSAIARRARVTPAMLHYYFGNREQLVDAVMDERIVPLVGRLGIRVAAAGGDPGELIRVFVATIITILAENPWLPQLWVREVLSEGGALRERLLKRVASQIAPQLAERFAEAKRRGALNPGLDPRLTVVSLIGLTIFPLAAQSIWRRLLDADDIGTDTLIAHTLALLESGLGTAPSPRKEK
jgi:TetR/AcrR family transcriptional regulator